MFTRDETRVKASIKLCEVLPLGSAALAGSNYCINRLVASHVLGFRNICLNSLDAVSDRDYVVEFIFCLSLTMIHLSRLLDELVVWVSSASKLVRLSDSYCTGSSIMPQKKNPDVLELIRGKAGKTVGNLVSIFMIMKAQCLAYNKDNQEDKQITFETYRVTSKSLKIIGKVISAL